MGAYCGSLSGMIRSLSRLGEVGVSGRGAGPSGNEMDELGGKFKARTRQRRPPDNGRSNFLSSVD